MRDAYVIRTPENVSFEFELAGVSSRALAWLIDVFIMLVATMASALVLSLFAPLGGGIAMALMSVAFFLIQWWYAALCEWRFSGRTVGKFLVGLRTLQATGVPITFTQAVIRNLVRVVDLLPALYLVGGISALLDGDGRRLGDLAAGTVVVRSRAAPPPVAIVAPHERHNSFVNDPGVRYAARRVTPPEREAMVALGLRRESLPLPVRHELYVTLSRHLEARLGVPRPPYFSEEKYVLNLTAVVLGLGADRSSRMPGP